MAVEPAMGEATPLLREIASCPTQQYNLVPTCDLKAREWCWWEWLLWCS